MGMKIVKQGKNQGLGDDSILNTELSDKKGNEIIINTCFLNSEGGMMDVLFEGKSTTGLIEMMIRLNDEWINNTQRRYPSKVKAITDHKKIIKNFEKKGVKAIFEFQEICGAGEFFSEPDTELKSLIK